MFKNSKILVVDDEESTRNNFSAFLEGEGYNVNSAMNYQSAIDILDDFEPDLIIADIMLGGYTGIDLLKDVKRKMRCPVVMVTGQPNIQTSAEAVRLGAFDYLTKPIKKTDLLSVVLKALKQKNLEDQNEKYKSNLEAIFRSLKSSVMTVSKEMVVTECNSSALRICNISHTEIIGKKIQSIQTQCSRECFKLLEKTIENNKTLSEHIIECKYINRINQTVIINTTPLLNQYQKCVGAVMLVRDITRLRNLENSLKERYEFHNIIGKSNNIQKAFDIIEKVSDLDTTVLITGESGTGKELIGKAIHYNGSRSDKELVTVNCNALSESLLESELFGHVKGSFTGAYKDKIGRFMMADGGTIFLDEIGDISHRIQLRLLRVLQEKEFERVGDSNTVKVDVRVIAATNCNLKEKINDGLFREDLYYRLKVVEIKVPPLRERREDIPLLIEYFKNSFNKKFNKSIRDVSKEVLNILMNYPWYGNIRELKNILEHAYIVCSNSIINLADLPQEIIEDENIKSIIIRNEPQKIKEVLKATDNNIAKAARIIGVSRPTLYSKIKKFKISI
ncbi:MAG: sigma-54-dependent Fis family transcriptional regulator [Desulfobacterales bacterium]|nr:sigma-54-dependent Fis family transcriptional regulator [Desulfobacterales bacterium]